MNNLYKDEAKARFGATDAFREFESKTAGYTEENRQSAEVGLSAVFAEFAECKAQGNAPDSKEAQALVKKLQSFITENFYTCTDEILNSLGAMYTADRRFKENIDKNGAGTAEFVSSAIGLYCG